LWLRLATLILGLSRAWTVLRRWTWRTRKFLDWTLKALQLLTQILDIAFVGRFLPVRLFKDLQDFIHFVDRLTK